MSEQADSDAIKKEEQKKADANATLGANTNLTEGCTIDPKKPGQTNASKNLKLTDDLDDINHELQMILAQLRLIEDCDLLLVLIQPYIKKFTDQLDEAIREQRALAEKYLPLIKPPTTPWGAVKYIKKQSAGTIWPKIMAYIKLALEIIELVNTVKKLIDAVKELEPKLKKCAKRAAESALNQTADVFAKNIEEVFASIEKEVVGAIDDVLGPVFCELAKLEAELQGVVGPTAALDYSSPGAFVGSLSNAVTDMDTKTQALMNEPIVERPGATASITNPDGSISNYKDGMLESVTPAPAPPA